MPSASIWPAMPPRPADLPELLTFFDFPQPLWRKLRTTNAIERCFVEVRRRTRPMVLFTNMQSVERILYAIFYRFNEHGCGLYLQPVQYGPGVLGARAMIVEPHPPPFYTSSLTSPPTCAPPTRA